MGILRVRLQNEKQTLADAVLRERHSNVRQLVLSGKARQPWVAGLILLENWVWARREREGLELGGVFRMIICEKNSSNFEYPHAAVCSEEFFSQMIFRSTR